MALCDGYLIINGVECKTVSVREKMYVIIGRKLHKLYRKWKKNKNKGGGKEKILALKGVCAVCEEEFLGELKSSRKYCSPLCRNRDIAKLGSAKYISFSNDKKLREKARSFINNAIKGGRIVKPKRCSNCDCSDKIFTIMAHHPDHNKFNEVIWLCASCHQLLHYGNDIEGELVMYNIDLHIYNV